MGFAVAAAALPLVKGIFKTPSEKRAAKVLGGVVSAARAGNLLAVKVLDERRAIGIKKEQAVWIGGWASIAGNTALIQRYELAKGSLPRIDHSSPEAAAAQALGAKASASATALDQALQPLFSAAVQNEANAREGVAQAIERVGLGGGAAAARAVRGEEGPLDQVMAFGRASPKLLLGAAVLGVLLLVVLLRRR